MAHSRAPQLVRFHSTLPPPKLDYASILSNSVYKSHNAFNRRVPIPLSTFPDLQKTSASLTQCRARLESLKYRRSQIGDKLREDPKNVEAMAEAKALKAEIKAADDEAQLHEEKLLVTASALPNDSHPLSPIGAEAASIQLAQHGPPPIPHSPSRHHVTLNASLHFMDLESGVTSTGSSWTYLTGLGASLELALVNYALSIAISRGFSPILTPDVVRSDIADRCGFVPKSGEASQNYHLASPHEGLVLAGTAEIPLAATFAGKIYNPDELPKKVVGLGRAFRAEAGARGAETRGLYRLHQFSKVELFAVTSGDVATSEAMMEEMRGIQEDIYKGLGLTFRVMDMSTEELGASAYRKYDMEAWMPGRGSWGEISSLSNCTDYQARRLHIRHHLPNPGEGPKTGFAHTLNGTAAAVPRLIVALLENGVRFEGEKVVGVGLPEALRRFWIGSEEGVEWVA